MPDSCDDRAMPDPSRGYGALRKGRFSSPGAEYLLTICLKRPASALCNDDVIARGRAELRRLEDEQAMQLRCATFMPDHMHLLVTLGQTANLSSVVRLFKGRMTALLRQQQATWQPNYFDHRLLPDEVRLPTFLYIFLNSYRKKLIAVDQQWSGYYCAPDDWAWFGSLTNEDCPVPEWLA